MSVKLSPFLNETIFASDGTLAVGYKIYTYVAGSVNTNQTTFTDSTGSVAQSNPIITNSRGQVDNPIWLTSGLAYKLRVFTNLDVFTGIEYDNVTGVNDSSATFDQWISSNLTPTYVTATQFTLAGDQTSNFQIGRRVKLLVTAGTVYGYISNSVFTTLTTGTVVLDSGVLDSGLSAVSYGILTPLNDSIPEKLSIQILNTGRSSVTQHATTMDLFALSNIIDGTGSAVPITAIVNAPQAGARRRFYGLATTSITNNAMFTVDGGTFTFGAGDYVDIEAVTTSTYKVHPFKADGTAVVSNTSSITKLNTSVVVTDTGTDGAATTTVDGVVAETRNASGKTSYVRGSIGSNSDTALPEYQCRAWVNFDFTTAGTFAGGASTVSRTGGSTTATITTTTAHLLTTGNHIQALTGVVAGDYVVTVLTATTFTITTVATTLLSAVAITFDFRLVRASGNINSVTNVSAGIGWVNISTAMPDANYSATLAAGGDTTTGSNAYLSLGATTVVGTQVQTASAIQVRGVNGANASMATTTNCVQIFR